MIGSAGVGKSSFCNTLVGEAVFKVSDGYGRETIKTQNYDCSKLKLNVIDTYGFGDFSSGAEET